MVHSIEFKQIEIQVFDGLKIGNESLKNLNQMLNLDDIEQIMDDTKEAVDYQNVFKLRFKRVNINYFFTFLNQRITELISGQFTQEEEIDFNMELDSIIDELLPEVPENQLPERVKETGSSFFKKTNFKFKISNFAHFQIK